MRNWRIKSAGGVRCACLRAINAVRLVTFLPLGKVAHSKAGILAGLYPNFSSCLRKLVIILRVPGVMIRLSERSGLALSRFLRFSQETDIFVMS